MKNALDNAKAFLNTRNELDTVTFTRQSNELNQRLKLLATNIMIQKQLRTIVSLHDNVSPPSVSAQDADTARKLHDDLLDQINFSFEHDILKAHHYDPYRNDF